MWGRIGSGTKIDDTCFGLEDEEGVLGWVSIASDGIEAIDFILLDSLELAV